jgi:phosphoenolpyruvate carboxykinase (ATP)
LDNVETVTDSIFGLHAPVACPGVPDEILIPRNTWADKEAYDAQAASLAERFKRNFQQFTVPGDDIRNAGPH